ncbi:MAG: hypothetical protein IJY12_00075 [Clostridia bacterium]|nr:hypothetical protein [Clostridia bacterium]
MSAFDIYIFCLCMIVCVALSGTFTFMIGRLYKLTVRLIRLGQEDDAIKTEYEKQTRASCLFRAIERIVSLVVCIVLLVLFLFSAYVSVQKDMCFGERIPTMRVVMSGSMAKKYETNTYLYENDLNDQFDTFDLLFVYCPPAAAELELYDIVVYEVDGVDVIHRIVGIEEPNESHPDERYFLLQGDAVEVPDRFPVHYSQIKAIYRGGKIPFVGSFIYFLQSPAGWICILLVIVAMIASSVVDKNLEKEKHARLVAMGVISLGDSDNSGDSDTPDSEEKAPEAETEVEV